MTILRTGIPAGRPRRRDANVLVVGLGGLGCPAALALARAGVDHLGLVDPDKVELSNLPRQILYDADDLGRPKAEVAARKLHRAYPQLRIAPFECELTERTFADIAGGFHFLIDATDQVTSKYVINDECVRSGTPFVYAGVVGLRGQMMTVLPQRSTCLRCIFPQSPDAADVPTCQESGVLGGLVGCFGYLQGHQALEFFRGRHESLSTNRLLTYDGSRGRWRSVALKRNPACPACGERQAATGRRRDMPPPCP